MSRMTPFFCYFWTVWSTVCFTTLSHSLCHNHVSGPFLVPTLGVRVLLPCCSLLLAPECVGRQTTRLRCSRPDAVSRQSG